MPSPGEIILWLVVGGFAGSLVGGIASFRWRGYGPLINTSLGVAGATVGGALFKVFRIDLGLSELKVTFEDLIAAVVGSTFVLLAVWGLRTKKKILFWVTTLIALAAVVVAVVYLSK